MAKMILKASKFYIAVIKGNTKRKTTRSVLTWEINAREGTFARFQIIK